MNIRILSIALLFGFGAQTGFGFDQATLDFVKQHKSLPRVDTAGKKGNEVDQLRERARDLSGANLAGADLSGANLYNANFTGANLSGANLSGTDLPWAQFVAANLTGADLTGAKFVHANFSSAMLTNANLKGANFDDARKEGNLRIWKSDLLEKGALNVDTVIGIN